MPDYWRSGEIGIAESDSDELIVRESGGELPKDTAMHYLLEDGTLRIRFCESGANPEMQYLLRFGLNV